MSKTANVHVRLGDVLHARLKRIAPQVRIRQRKERTSRDAFLTELLQLGAELLVDHLEQGADALHNLPPGEFYGARQVAGLEHPEIVGIAPLASREVYRQLAETRQVPTLEEQESLDLDAELIEDGSWAYLRGHVFSDPRGTRSDLPEPGTRGKVTFRRGRGPLFDFEAGAEPVEVSIYDLVPAEQWDHLEDLPL